jgi:hypothetical protein
MFAAVTVSTSNPNPYPVNPPVATIDPAAKGKSIRSSVNTEPATAVTCAQVHFRSTFEKRHAIGFPVAVNPLALATVTCTFVCGNVLALALPLSMLLVVVVIELVGVVAFTLVQFVPEPVSV